MLRFNARGPDGLLNGKSPGQPSKLNDAQRQAIARMIESGPIPAVHGVVRWRLIDLAQWIFEEFRITIAKQTLSRELRAMGYRKLSARPRHHAQAEGAIEDFKKASPRAWRQSRARRRSTCDTIEIWFADEARIGQKNKITRRWAKRGTRPSAPRDQRTASTYIFGAVCPKRGQGCGPDPARLQHRGDEPASRGDRRDRRARRPRRPPGRSGRLALSTTLRRATQHHHHALPPKCPELNPVENVWQFMRDNWLSNRVFKSYDDLVDHCCVAWNKLVDQPWRIMSIGSAPMGAPVLMPEIAQYSADDGVEQ